MGWRKSPDERAEVTAEKLRAAYLASPLGRAEGAHDAGLPFFELSLPRSFRPEEDISAILGEIEAVGWRLDQMAYISTGADAPGCLYLFRRADVVIDLVRAENAGRNGNPVPGPHAAVTGPPMGFDPRSWPEWQARPPGADPNAEWPVWLQTWAARSGWYVRRHG